jgi:endonuclease YncB( thermonuclease family)
MRKIALCVIACLVWSGTEASDLSGVPRVVDGDTLTIGATKIRMEGIDAPETDQICLDAQASRWACGIEARNQLASFVSGQAIN